MAITVGNNTNSGAKGALASYTWNHTCNAGSNTILVVTVVGDTSVVSTVKYNSVTMTAGPTLLSGSTYASIFYLKTPTTGTNAILVTMTSAVGNSGAAAVDFFGVDQTTPSDSTGTGTNTNTSATASCTIVNANAWVVAGLMVPSQPVTLTLTGTGSPVSIMNIDDSTNGQHVAAQYNGPDGTGAHASTWTINASQFWVEAAMALKPAAGGGFTYQQLEGVTQPLAEPRKGVLI